MVFQNSILMGVRERVRGASKPLPRRSNGQSRSRRDRAELGSGGTRSWQIKANNSKKKLIPN